jgi:hypothetical protein
MGQVSAILLSYQQGPLTPGDCPLKIKTKIFRKKIFKVEITDAPILKILKMTF